MDADRRSKSFLDSLGHDGLNRMLDGFDDRSAEAVCTFAFCRGPGAEPVLFQGRTEVRFYLFCWQGWMVGLIMCQGAIVRPRGPTNFGMLVNCCRPVGWADGYRTGWDPIFEYQGTTYAEMEKEAKVISAVDDPSQGYKLTTRIEPNLAPLQGTRETAAVALRRE